MRLSTKLTIATSLVAGVLQFSVGSAVADQLGWAVDPQNLFIVDVTTAQAARIGPTGQFLEGLAFSPQGRLFGTDYLGNLYSVSTSTGAASLIGSTGLGDIEGLGFQGSTLIGTNFSNLGGPTTVSAINTTTAAPTTITSFQQGPARAMAVLNSNTIDVASDSPATPSLATQSLVQVNLTTGNNTVLGQLPGGGADLISSLSLGTGGTLFALDALGNDFMIASNGAGILIGNTGGQQWLDLTLVDPPVVGASGLDPAPVPQPNSIAFLLTAAVALIGLRVWRRSGNSTGS
jgi:hypothetical protein